MNVGFGSRLRARELTERRRADESGTENAARGADEAPPSDYPIGVASAPRPLLAAARGTDLKAPGAPPRDVFVRALPFSHGEKVAAEQPDEGLLSV